jgi:flavin-dependent dehydrogenase
MTENAFDAIVIGAGPAGSLAACLLARTGAHVLLVERQAFPRPKVCGGCLNAHALAALERAGLAGRVRTLGPRPITAVRTCQRSRSATLALPPGLAISRAPLDAELAAAAIDAGAVFAPETTARVVDEGPLPAHDGWRQVTLQPRQGQKTTARGRIVLAADGLSHGSLRACASMRSLLAPRARVGLGGLVPVGAVETAAGTITMAVGRHGYVGAVEVEGGRVNVAAALDPGFLKAQPSAAAAVTSILFEAGVRFDRRLESADWSGTIPLTRRLPVPAARRLFVLGDAAGYVEPFTGEGMAWAFAAAEAVVPLAIRAIEGWNDEMAGAWVATYARRIGRQQRWCRVVARLLRSPALVTPVVALLQRQPGLARPLLAHLRPPVRPCQ